MKTTTTAWGKATVLERVSVSQTADGKSFASIIELLEGDGGETFVRFAYSTDGVARRGPVTMRTTDLRRLEKSLAKAPRLRTILGECTKGPAG